MWEKIDHITDRMWTPYGWIVRTMVSESVSMVFLPNSEKKEPYMGTPFDSSWVLPVKKKEDIKIPDTTWDKEEENND